MCLSFMILAVLTRDMSAGWRRSGSRSAPSTRYVPVLFRLLFPADPPILQASKARAGSAVARVQSPSESDADGSEEEEAVDLTAARKGRKQQGGSCSLPESACC